MHAFYFCMVHAGGGGEVLERLIINSRVSTAEDHHEPKIIFFNEKVHIVQCTTALFKILQESQSHCVRNDMHVNDQICP